MTPQMYGVFVTVFLAMIGAAVYVARELANLSTEVKGLRRDVERFEKSADHVNELESRLARVEVKVNQ